MGFYIEVNKKQHPSVNEVVLLKLHVFFFVSFHIVQMAKTNQVLSSLELFSNVKLSFRFLRYIHFISLQ